jgi:hypothetical protein
MTAVSAQAGAVLRFDPSLELWMQAFGRIRCSDRFPSALWKAHEDEQRKRDLKTAFLDMGGVSGPMGDVRIGGIPA